MGFEDWLYDPDGNPIDFEQFTDLQARGLEVCGVGREAVGSYVISTVWVGVSATDPPLIYETAVFDQHDKVIEVYRWPNRQTAELEHQRMVERYRRDYGHVTNGKNIDEH